MRVLLGIGLAVVVLGSELRTGAVTGWSSRRRAPRLTERGGLVVAVLATLAAAAVSAALLWAVAPAGGGRS